MTDRTDHVEAIRSLYESWGRGDFSHRLELDEHAMLLNHPDMDARGPYHGPRAIAAFTRAMLEAWSDFTVEAEEIAAAGDSVIVSQLQRGTGRTSGVETELRYLMVWTFRGGKVIRLESFRDRAEAYRAVGRPS